MRFPFLLPAVFVTAQVVDVLQPAPLTAQVSLVPTECREIDVEASQLPLPYSTGTHSLRFTKLVVDALWVGIDSRGSAEARINTLWAKDSNSVEWILAHVAATDIEAGAVLSLLATDEYRRLSGRAGVMLSMIAGSPNRYRRGIALQGITTLGNAAYEDIVFGYVCDATREFAAWRTYGALGNSINGEADPNDTMVLSQASRLVRGTHRAALLELIQTLNVDSAVIELIEPGTQ